jgi:hypothetical protein
LFCNNPMTFFNWVFFLITLFNADFLLNFIIYYWFDCELIFFLFFSITSFNAGFLLNLIIHY